MTKVLLRRDTLENWIEHDPVLKKDEIVKVFFSDRKPKFKVGDGVNKFSDLPYIDRITVDADTPLIIGVGPHCFEVRFDVNLDGSLPDGTL